MHLLSANTQYQLIVRKFADNRHWLIVNLHNRLILYSFTEYMSRCSAAKQTFTQHTSWLWTQELPGNGSQLVEVDAVLRPPLQWIRPVVNCQLSDVDMGRLHN